MKPCLTAVLVVVISLLFNEAQGIRFNKGRFFSFVGQHHEIIHEERSSANSLIKTSDGEDCKSKSSTVTGSVDRKLTSSTTFSTTRSKNEGNPTSSTLQAEKNFSANSPPTSNDDLTDIAEMDYSPARRKPPIHN